MKEQIVHNNTSAIFAYYMEERLWTPVSFISKPLIYLYVFLYGVKATVKA